MDESERRPGAGSKPGAEAKPGVGPTLDGELVCQVCGRAGSGAELLSWVMDRRPGTVSWTCPGCAAIHIRALEAKLEPEWW